MKYDDNNPLHRKQMMDHLTKGPTRTSLAMQKDLQKNPKLTVDELVKRQKTKLNENMIPAANKKPGSSVDDIFRNLLIEEMKVRDLDEDEIKYMMDTKPRNQLRTQKISNTGQRILAKQTNPYPSQATPAQVQYLKNKLDKMKYQNKPFNKKVKPTLKTESIKLNINPISLAPEPPKEDPRLKELELRVLESQKRNQFEKSRGLPNLIGTKV